MSDPSGWDACDEHEWTYIRGDSCVYCDLATARAERDKLREEVAASGGLKCPSCDDEGWYAVQIAEDEWEQEQCEFCYVVDDSIFNRKQAALKQGEG